MFGEAAPAASMMMSTILSITTSKLSEGDSTAAELPKLFKSTEHGWTSYEIKHQYNAIARDPHYFQFANIPQRIIHCLESFATVFQPETAQARLLAYYLFIGVVDDEIESAQFEIAERTLIRLANPLPCFDQDTRSSKSQFMTEVLKQHIDPAIHSQVVLKFSDLHQANLAERQAATMKGYIAQRRVVGNLTAELSYLLIQDLVSSEKTDCCRLMKDVGAVGCLVDSVIDAPEDRRAGTLLFKPDLSDFLFLCFRTFVDGLKLVWSYPRLLPLFADATRDNFYDRLRPHTRVSHGDSAGTPAMK
jgi:hypothetical protein